MQKFWIAGQCTPYISVHDHEQPAEVFPRVKGQDCSSELIGLYGGTGSGSAHKPFLVSRASFSSPSSTQASILIRIHRATHTPGEARVVLIDAVAHDAI
jgi:hypothetical protein